MLTIEYAGKTDVGRVRTANEDRWFADPASGLYMVADGMGGEFGGGLASKVVVESLPGILKSSFGESSCTSELEAIEIVLATLRQLSDTLRNESRDEPGLDGMGSTVVLALIRDGKALIAHLGDSRAYRLHDGLLTQLTADHTIVQLLIDSGEITPEEAESHPARDRLTRFVGMEGEALPEAGFEPVEQSDRLLLCSDGLVGMLDDPTIEQLLVKHSDPTVTCQSLVDAANAAGGKDNVTCLVMGIA